MYLNKVFNRKYAYTRCDSEPDGDVNNVQIWRRKFMSRIVRRGRDADINFHCLQLKPKMYVDMHKLRTSKSHGVVQFRCSGLEGNIRRGHS